MEGGREGRIGGPSLYCDVLMYSLTGGGHTFILALRLTD